MNRTLDAPRPTIEKRERTAKDIPKAKEPLRRKERAALYSQAGLVSLERIYTNQPGQVKREAKELQTVRKQLLELAPPTAHLIGETLEVVEALKLGTVFFPQFGAFVSIVGTFIDITNKQLAKQEQKKQIVFEKKAS